MTDRHLDEDRVRAEREDTRWYSTVYQHERSAMSLQEFRDALPQHAPVQFILMATTRTAVASTLTDGRVIYGWGFDPDDRDDLPESVLNHIRKPNHPLLRLGTVFQVEGEAVREVALAESLFGPMIPPERVSTYQMQYPRWVRLSFVVASVGCFVIGSLIIIFGPYRALGFVVWSLAVSPMVQLHYQGRTFRICESELPPTTRRRLWQWPQRGVKYRGNLPSRWLIKLEESS